MKNSCTFWVVEFDHKHGTKVWIAKTEALAETIVHSVKTHLYHEYNEDRWTLAKALENWSEFTGDTEAFRINKITLIDTQKAAKDAKA